MDIPELKSYFDFFPKNIYCWFGGGLVRSLFDNSKTKDIDVFVSNRKDQESIGKHLLSSGATHVINRDILNTFEIDGLQVDIFCEEEGSNPADSVIWSDYTITACAIDCHGNMYYHPDFIEDCIAKRLQYIGNDITISQAYNRPNRLKRFLDIGYEIDQENMLKLLDRICLDKLPLQTEGWKPTINKFHVETKTTSGFISKARPSVESTSKPEPFLTPSRDCVLKAAMLDTTIVVSTFDRPRCLDRLIRSILKYYPNIPIIVVDNGIVEYNPPKLFNSHVKVLRIKKDAGLSACRNMAVEHVKTEYLFIIDDDVIFTDTTKIENFLSVLYEDRHIDIVGGLLWDEDNVELPATHKIPGRENLIAQCDIDLEIVGDTLFKYPSPASRKKTKHRLNYKYVDYVINFFLARTKLFKDIRWDNDLKLAEHFDFFLRLKNMTSEYGRRVAFTPDVKADHKNDSREEKHYREHRSRSKHFFKMSKDKHGVKDVVFSHRDWAHRTIRGGRDKQSWQSPMFLGIGTGRCGTVSLAKLIGGCDNCEVFHEANWEHKQHKHNTPLPWVFDEGQASLRIKNMKKRESVDSLFGDVAFYYLNYLDFFLKEYPNLKIVHIHRDKEEVVKSYLAKTSSEFSAKEYDNWTKGSNIADKIWTPCYPQYEVDSKREGISRYYDEYISKTEKYKDRMFEIDVKNLNSFEYQTKLFDYLQIPYRNRKHREVMENTIITTA